MKGSNKFNVTSINNRTLTDVLTNAWIKDEDVIIKTRQTFNHAIFSESLNKVKFYSSLYGSEVKCNVIGCRKRYQPGRPEPKGD